MNLSKYLASFILDFLICTHFAIQTRTRIMELSTPYLPDQDEKGLKYIMIKCLCVLDYIMMQNWYRSTFLCRYYCSILFSSLCLSLYTLSLPIKIPFARNAKCYRVCCDKFRMRMCYTVTYKHNTFLYLLLHMDNCLQLRMVCR